MADDYANAANNGLRAPDFISLNVNVGIPYLLNLVGPTVAVNIGRNGHVYIGPGVNVGKAATLVSGSVTANWMTQPNQMQSFLTKNSFSVNAGYWGGVQGAWTPGSGLAGGRVCFSTGWGRVDILFRPREVVWRMVSL